MNPLIKRVTEKVIGHEIRLEDMSIAKLIGDAVLEAIKSSQYNSNWNLKGGMDVDENTIGNFHVPNSTMEGVKANYIDENGNNVTKEIEIDFNNISEIDFQECFKGCSILKSIDIKNWDTDNMLAMIVVKNADYIKYAKENNLDYWFQSVIGDVIIMASKASHPKLFDGSLD